MSDIKSRRVKAHPKEQLPFQAQPLVYSSSAAFASGDNRDRIPKTTGDNHIHVDSVETAAHSRETTVTAETAGVSSSTGNQTIYQSDLVEPLIPVNDSISNRYEKVTRIEKLKNRDLDFSEILAAEDPITYKFQRRDSM